MPKRRRRVGDGVDALVSRCVAAAPRKGVVICHGLVYRCAAQPLSEAGLKLLHDEPLPFPSMGNRPKFVASLPSRVRRQQLAGLRGSSHAAQPLGEEVASSPVTSPHWSRQASRPSPRVFP